MSDAPTPSNNMTRGERTDAIERATKRSWSDWVAFFDAKGAREMTHAEIAKLALPEMPADLPNEGWWAQGTAIAYEQHVGLRVPGQSSAGTFRVGASRTVDLDRDAAIEAWANAHGARAEHLGHAAGEPRTSRTEKRSFWRFGLDGAGKVEVAATPARAAGRATVTVGHEGLADGDRLEEWRAHWKSLLAEL